MIDRDPFQRNSLAILALAYRDSWREQNNLTRVKINLTLWFFLCITNVTDLIVSYSLFSRGAIEINPAMSFLCSHFGNISLAFYKGFLLGTLFILLPFIKNKLQILLISTCGIYLILVFTHIMRF
ncbi:hypothetical protein JW824_05390 [bacterium]|nr:hypothetical protein [bacterium]RQV96310.1 MAG: hypothetical protein EH221_04895 [bacterium]